MSSSPHRRSGPPGAGTGAAAPTSRWSRMLPLAIIALGLAELAILVLIGVNTSLWWAVLIVVVSALADVVLVMLDPRVRASGQRSQ